MEYEEKVLGAGFVIILLVLVLTFAYDIETKLRCYEQNKHRPAVETMLMCK